MLKKLRWKFILINMGMMSLILINVFSAIVISTSRQNAQTSLDAMEKALYWSGYRPSIIEFTLQTEPQVAERNLIVPAFCVTTDLSGNVLFVASGSDVSVSGKILSEAVRQALASEKSIGVLPQLGLRYLVDHSPTNNIKVVFCDQRWERTAIIRLVFTFVLIGICALIVLFFISFFLSRLALKPVERAWSQQSQFSADASHELKTPLTVILANVGIIQSRPHETVASQRKWLSFIEEEALRMKGLVEDLLYLAKNDDAHTTLDMEPVNISDILTGSVLRFETVAFENQIALESEIQENLTMFGNRTALQRLGDILLDNGIKYSGAGGRVCLRLYRQQDKIGLSITNSGTPIPAENLSHIFERFYRADSSRSRESGGYGLGLAIAHSIVTSHSGQITANSTKETGTTFTVTFPTH